jgi:hypothetical protein
VYEAVTSGTVYRSGLAAAVGSKAFTGDFTASNAKITLLANGSAASDAATMGQISNASNLTEGTLAPARLNDASIPLEKLSASRVTYTLPSDALPNANTLSAITSYGSSTATNANNIIYASVDPKGRITNVGHRNLAAGDLPNTAVTANTYGSANTKVPQITVDAQGRITAASDRTLGAGDISSVNASAVSGTLAAGNLPLVSGYSGTTSTTSIPTSITVDTFGRVTAVSSSGLTASNISDFNTAVQTSKLNQMAAPIASVSLNSQKIINLGAPVEATDAATRGYVDTNFTSTTNLTAAIDTRLTTNAVYLSAAGILNAGGKPITNVGATTNANDVVTKSYLEANAIYATGANLSAGTKYLTDLIMRPSGSLSANDAVNFGYIETAIINAGGQQLVGTSSPQVFKQTWASANAITSSTPSAGYIRYQFNFVDPATVLYATSATMMLVEGTGGTRVFTPNLSNATQTGVNAVYDGYFWLDTSGGATKVLNVYVNSTPTGDITIRNFGLSRIVAGGTATESSTGLVSIAPGTEGGISVSGAGAIALIPATSGQLGGVKLGSSLSTSSGLVNVVFPTAGNATRGQVMVDVVANSGLSLDTSTGALSLPTASTTQLGGVKIDTTAGLTNTSGSISVTRSDSTTSNSTTTLANSKAVSDLRTSSMLLDGTQTMTGKLKTFASTASVASLNVPIGTVVTSPASGDIWNVNGNLQYSPNGTAIKTLAYLDSSITGNAATATKLAAPKNITLSGAVTSTGTAFDGSGDITISTALASSAAVISLSSSYMTVSNGGTGAVTLTLPQAIGTSSDVQFNTARLGNITLGVNTINTATGTGNLIIDSAGGTTTINDTVSIAGPLTVTNTNATALGGVVTLGSNLVLNTLASTIAFGGVVGTATTSLNIVGTTTGIKKAGDFIFRVPGSGVAYLVANNIVATDPVATDAIITEGVLASRISGLSSTYMSRNGATRSDAGDQTLGIGTDSGSFLVKTGLTPTTRLTIANSGAATFANALTVSSGGLNIVAGGLTAVGTTSLTGTVTLNSTVNTANGVIVATQAPYSPSHLTNKAYVDATGLYPYVDIIDATSGITPTNILISSGVDPPELSPFNSRISVTVGETYWYKAQFTGNANTTLRTGQLRIIFLAPTTYKYDVILGARSQGVHLASPFNGNGVFTLTTSSITSAQSNSTNPVTTGINFDVGNGGGNTLTKYFWYGVRVSELNRPGMIL